MSAEAAQHADFSLIRYAQCWEDADILLDALRILPGDVCLSIASAGDNALAMLLGDPEKVIAIDLSPAQLACLALRIAAFRLLDHDELLQLIGSRLSDRRAALYARCRVELHEDVRNFWDAQPALIEQGIGAVGKFEKYFELFRRRVLPLIHNRTRIEQLLRGGSREEREKFYDGTWDTWRWRLLFRIFFSRFVMGRLGRDPSFFRFVEGSVSDRILARSHHALTALNPAENPYLQWILTGRHTTAYPCALRPEHFETIRARLDRIEPRRQSLEEFLDEAGPNSIDRFNLSDVFEYMSEAQTQHLLERLAECGRAGGRLVYWNMLAPRCRGDALADRLGPKENEAGHLHAQDKAWFYSRLCIEEIIA